MNKAPFQRSLPPVGGGSPIITASAMTPADTGSRPPGEPVTVTLTFTANEEAEKAGREVVRIIAAACSEPTTKAAIERVASLRFLFPSIAVKVPEFYGFMDELISTGREQQARRIMRDPRRPGRGRRRSALYLVALVEQVLVENPGWDAKRAAKHIFENIERYVRTPHRIENVYSECRKWYALWRQSLYVPAEIVTKWWWGVDVAEREALFAKLRENLREDEVGEAGPYTFADLYALFVFPRGGGIVLVDGADPDFGPYARYRTTDPSRSSGWLESGWRCLSEQEWQEALSRCEAADTAAAVARTGDRGAK